jgi:NADH dehydrogenase [ubiquinone] 1 alpha subcomplex assembly factor 7
VSPLADHLRGLIEQTGPISVARWMAECLGHPRHGYYQTRDPLGAAGDFTTAPEISQVFGELLGLACADAWLRLGRPDPVTVVELGPGRGTLMADAWRALGTVADLRRAARIALVETSPVLRAKQKEALANLAGAPSIVWVERVADLPDGPILLLANEFFDALPIRQFVRGQAGWQERLVTWDAAGQRFAFTLGPAGDPGAMLIDPMVRDSAPVGAVAEVCPAGLSIAATLAERVVGAGGRAIIVDYGPAHSAPGDSLQAVRGHGYADPLTAPGEQDLTAHVDFARLAEVARQAGAAVTGPVSQRDFLFGLGIRERTAALKTAAPDQALAIDAALDRLTASGERQMGTLFKALLLDPPGLAQS